MNIRIKGGNKLTGEITPSGSKNSVVALIPATLLFDSPITLSNVPDITDVARLVEILTKMGSKMTWDKKLKTLNIDNKDVFFNKADVGQEKGIRGTTLLWGPMLARFGRATSEEQPAGCTLGARPIDPHYQAFMDLGVIMNGYDMDAKNAKAGNIWLLEASPTATENAIMLAVKLPGTTNINHAACEPHVQDLCNFLNNCGADISGIGSNVITINGGKPLTAKDYRVISDIYEVGTFLALGALTGGEIKVNDALPQHSTAINREFAKFGIEIKFNGDVATVSSNQKITITKTKSPMIVRAQPWPALPVDMLPLFIPLALAAPTGQTMFHNWMYESGLYWTTELIKLGANVVMCDPHRVLVISGNKLKGAKMDAPYIIRATISMVMSAMIAEGESIITSADSILRAHPDFVENLKKLGAEIEEV